MDYFYRGKVLMEATTPAGDLVEKSLFDHDTHEGRIMVREFVHKNLCLGNTVKSIPISPES